MNVDVHFRGLTAWQMAKIIRAAERIGLSSVAEELDAHAERCEKAAREWEQKAAEVRQ